MAMAAAMNWSCTAAMLVHSSNNNRGVPAVPHIFINNQSSSSWLVKTESNVRKEVRKKPNPPCVVCNGTGRVHCNDCSGTGRTNQVHLAMLPKGEWPKWCKLCGGSGLDYCPRCLGHGNYRDTMGFRFMKIEDSLDNITSHQHKSE
ncbi:hypothetical protein ACFE04_019158 [Oxalis oulophora]